MFVRLLACLLCLLPLTGHAQTTLPEQRYIYTQDYDFVGPDLASLFETTQKACERACSAQPECTAFTFNSRSNSCFPKSAVNDRAVYVGAFSAIKVPTLPEAKALAQTRRSELDFLRDGDFDTALTLAEELPGRFPVDDRSLQDVLAAIRSSSDPRSRERWTANALAIMDGSDQWSELSQIRASGNGRFANRIRQQALPAAVNAYLRAGTVGEQTRALWAMSQALETAGRGRDVVKALRLAEDIAPGAFTEPLDAAVGKYGFRVINHLVESDTATPRICAVFSDSLAPAGIAYDTYVQTGNTTLAVDAEGQRLCFDGAEHGERYSVTLRRGLPAADGETLIKNVTLSFYVRDRQPSVRFGGRAFVLPKRADVGIPVETVNADTLELTLYRVSDRNLLRSIKDDYFGRPLSAYQKSQFTTDLAQEIWTGIGEVQNELNRDMTTRLPLDEALADQSPGVFALAASVPGQNTSSDPVALQWFVLTDLGLSTMSGVDGLHVTALGFGDAKPREGVTLSLISRANEVLGEMVTDATGGAQFPAGLSRGRNGAQPALVVAETPDDFAFMPLTDPAFDLSDRGVEGHPPSPPIDTFLTTDRGIYRAGEVIYATALARDASAAAITGLPLVAVLNRPDGVEYSRHISSDDVAGGHVFELPVGATAPRGAWRIDIFADTTADPVASQRILVEDFLPERIDFDMALDDGPVTMGQTQPLTVTARYLFGAAGAELKVNGTAALAATRNLPGYDGYLFGRYDERFDPEVFYFQETLTDAAGKGIIPLNVPAPTEQPTRPLEAQITVEVAEGSGRPVERQMTRAIASGRPAIGVQPLFDDMLAEGAEAGFRVISVGGDTPVRWTVNRVHTHYQWYQVNGRWYWEPITRRTQMSSGDAVLSETPMPLSISTEWGEYEIVVQSAASPDVVTSVSFSAGWYGGGDSSDTPDRLDVVLDRATYDVGDTARLRVVAPGEGTLLLSVLSNRVVDRRVVQVTKGDNLIPLEVTEAWGSGAYVSATVIRPMDDSAGKTPTRSLGLAHAAVQPDGKLLDVSIDAPDLLDGQEGSFTAAVQVSGGQPAYVTLAAVDLGILNMTGFEPPDAGDHYFGQRRLGVELRDVYGRLINGRDGALGRVRSGGGSAPEITSAGEPPKDAIMAFFSGPVAVGPDGRAEIEIERPAFNGTIRLMAVAWSDSGVGSAWDETVVRDPVVVTPSLPRQLSPGDDSRVLLEFVHTDGPAGDMPLTVDTTGPLQVSDVPSAVTLTAGGSTRVSLPLQALREGDGTVNVSLGLPDGRTVTKELMLPVQPKDPAISEVRRVSLAPGQSLTFDDTDLAQLYDGEMSISAGPLAKLRVPTLVQQLDRYPYGCTEQVTSGALPLLYLGGLADRMGLGTPGDVESRISGAIDKVLARQGANGAFGLWSAPSYAAEPWLDAYVTDFLLRAKEQGHEVPEIALAQALDNLRNRVNSAPDFNQGGEELAYALWVLARAGAANIGDLRYYADEKKDAFGTPLALAQLGAALSAYGDTQRAERLFVAAYFRMSKSTGNGSGWRGDFGSKLRDTAAILRLASEANSPPVLQERLVDMVSRTRTMSTQEAAQVTMAAYELGESAPFDLRVDGSAVEGPVVARFSRGGITVTNAGAPVDLTVETYGVPKQPTEASGYGYALDRRYFAMDGTEITGPIAAGTRLVAVLTVTPFEADRARLMINDALPGGLEIDNPNLLQRGAVSGLEWLEPVGTDTAEFRSDRFLAAVTYAGTDPFRVAYMVRAVTPGVYHHPAALVEDMYRPLYRANTASGRLTVTQ